MPQRRLHIVNILEEGAIGGPQRRSVAVAEELANRDGFLGADTTLLFPQSAHDLAGLCAEKGISYAQLPISTLRRKRVPALTYAATFVPQTLRMAKWIRRSSADVVHVSGGTFCLKGAFAARIARVPYVWHLNDTKMHPAVKEAFKVVTRICRPARLIYAGHAVARSYAPWVPPKVPSAVVPAPHRKDLVELKKESFDDPYPADRNRLRVLMLSNINTVKGIDDAIEAFESLTSDATLFIAGGVTSSQTDYLQRLQEQVRTKSLSVEFLGHCSDIAPYLLHADISLCASLAEASPLSVWEAAATGNAIVSTDVGDVARELPHDVAALIVPVGDSAAIASAIDRLACDETLRARLGAEAKKLMQVATSIEHVADLSLLTYSEAAA